MKVGLFGPYPPPHGGVEINVVAQQEYLHAQGVSCDVINLTRHRKQPQPDVHYPRSAFGVLWLLIRRRYDVAHLHVGGDLDPRALALGVLCSWIPGMHTVFTLHSGGYPTSERGRTATKHGARAFALRRFDAIIAVNNEIRLFFERLGVPPNRIHVITPAAVSQQQIARVREADRASTFGAELSDFLAAHTPVLVTVGGLEREYDVPTQVDAMELVQQVHPSAGLVVIGSGRLADEIEAYAAAKPWRADIWFAGDVDHEVAMCAIADADVFLRTSLYDGDAISVREALHFGTPVVATRTASRPSGVTLVAVSDPAALASAIIGRLANDRPAPVPGDQSGVEAVLKLYASLVS